MKLFGYTLFGSEEPKLKDATELKNNTDVDVDVDVDAEKEIVSGSGRMMMLKNVLIGSGLGLASGYSYHKYRQMASVGFGIGFFATQMKKRVWKYLDFNGDGKVNFEDVEVIEDKLDFQITLVGIGAFACGFGGGYVVGFW